MGNSSGRQILPGFSLTLGYTIFYLSVIVLIPCAALFLKAFSYNKSVAQEIAKVPEMYQVQAGETVASLAARFDLLEDAIREMNQLKEEDVLNPGQQIRLRERAATPGEHFWKTVTDPRVVASYRLSFGASLAAALFNGVFGLLAAWVLVRYEFPGRKVLDAMVDLPFALPTAVAGIALTTIYAPNGLIGKLFYDNPELPDDFFFFNWKIAYTWWGVFLALTFIGLPFVVRTVQPVLQDLAAEVEEAAACLGANRWQTFTRVILPAIFPALVTGILLAFGRAVGEFGSVVFISGNLPFKTEITPLLITIKLEQYDYAGAASIGLVMLLTAFVIILGVNGLQWWANQRAIKD
jgi:sulfate transport system permease protein